MGIVQCGRQQHGPYICASKHSRAWIFICIFVSVPYLHPELCLHCGVIYKRHVRSSGRSIQRCSIRVPTYSTRHFREEIASVWYFTNAYAYRCNPTGFMRHTCNRNRLEIAYARKIATFIGFMKKYIRFYIKLSTTVMGIFAFVRWNPPMLDCIPLLQF